MKVNQVNNYSSWPIKKTESGQFTLQVIPNSINPACLLSLTKTLF